MEPLATIKLELGINAQRIISQYQTNNKKIEDVVRKGIERALKEVIEDNNFEDVIVKNVKDELMKTIKYAAADWSIRNKLREAIGKAIAYKIDSIANSWAEKALKNINEK